MRQLPSSTFRGRRKWQLCNKCNRYLKNDTCFQKHQRKSDNGKRTCEKYFKCMKSDQTIIEKHKKAHVCEETYCKTCKDIYAEGHWCYMQPVDTENNSLKKATKKKKHFEYMFFYFECTQDETLECEEGFTDGKNGKCGHCNKSLCGTNQHRPNLCVVHKVCELCLDSTITSASTYNSCGKNEREFQGFHTIEHFCKWLFFWGKCWCHSDLPQFYRLWQLSHSLIPSWQSILFYL